jgi:hypothetical protein
MSVIPLANRTLGLAVLLIITSLPLYTTKNKIMKVINKATGKEHSAQYAANRRGNMRYHVEINGEFKSLTDQQFDKHFSIMGQRKLSGAVMG